MTWRIIEGDALAVLKSLPAASVQCSVSSPPYWGLREYVADEHPLKQHELGLEPTPEIYVERLVAIYREVRRVLRDDGTCWVNLGDSYATSGGLGRGGNAIRIGRTHQQRNVRPTAGVSSGCKPKDLVGIPWAVAFALRADGWYLRQEIIWAKANPMPESVADQPTRSHEQIFLLSKSPAYYYDANAIREPTTGGAHSRGEGLHPKAAGANSRIKANVSFGAALGGSFAGERNKRSVWHVAIAPYAGAHFATFPPQLIAPCVLAGTSEVGCCPACGRAWVRIVDDPDFTEAPRRATSRLEGQRLSQGSGSLTSAGQAWQDWRDANPSATVGWARDCACPHAAPVPCTVLDPFSGAGTTGLVATRAGRSYVGVELNEAYAAMSRDRIMDDAPLLNRWSFQP